MYILLDNYNLITNKTWHKKITFTEEPLISDPHGTGLYSKHIKSQIVRGAKLPLLQIQ